MFEFAILAMCAIVILIAAGAAVCATPHSGCRHRDFCCSVCRSCGRHFHDILFELGDRHHRKPLRPQLFVMSERQYWDSVKTDRERSGPYSHRGILDVACLDRYRLGEEVGSARVSDTWASIVIRFRWDLSRDEEWLLGVEKFTPKKPESVLWLDSAAPKAVTA